MKEAVISSTNYTEKEPSSQAKKKRTELSQDIILVNTASRRAAALLQALHTATGQELVEPESVNHRKPAYDLIRDKQCSSLFPFCCAEGFSKGRLDVPVPHQLSHGGFSKGLVSIFGHNM